LIGASAVNLKTREVLIWCIFAGAAMLCALGSAKAAETERHVAFSTGVAQSHGNSVPAASLALGVTGDVADQLEGQPPETSRAGLISTALPPAIPCAGTGSPLLRASLAFTVSVCFADVEYSIACWERGLLEATKRLEQIYLDDFTTRKAAGSLRIWFPLATDGNEQLRFLRETEERAIKNAVVKLQAESDRQIKTPTSALDRDSPTTSAQEMELLRQRVQQLLQKWREDAVVEARRGTNWSHEWSSRTHSYQLGQALRELVQIANRSHSAR
jgi:hypothetical protein